MASKQVITTFPCHQALPVYLHKAMTLESMHIPSDKYHVLWSDKYHVLWSGAPTGLASYSEGKKNPIYIHEGNKA